MEGRPADKVIRDGFMTKVSIEEVQARINDAGDNVTIVDSRSDAAYGESDIKAAGAIRIPPDKAEKHIADVRRDDPVFVYCT